jgi:hypothetical protein
MSMYESVCVCLLCDRTVAYVCVDFMCVRACVCVYVGTGLKWALAHNIQRACTAQKLWTRGYVLLCSFSLKTTTDQFLRHQNILRSMARAWKLMAHFPDEIICLFCARALTLSPIWVPPTHEMFAFMTSHCVPYSFSAMHSICKRTAQESMHAHWWVVVVCEVQNNYRITTVRMFPRTAFAL